MFEITCLDSNDNSIDHFTQWDVGQRIKIVLNGYNGYSLDVAPQIHLCNTKMDSAFLELSTTSSSVDGGKKDTITFGVPDELLMEPYPLMIYVYLTTEVWKYTDENNEEKDITSQKTILQCEIPVRKRAKPEGYSGISKSERVTVESMIKSIIRGLTIVANRENDGNVKLSLQLLG